MKAKRNLLKENKELKDRLSKAEELLAAIKSGSAGAFVADTQEIVREHQRLYSVLEALPVYVVLLDKDYCVPFANKFFRERFGESHGRRCYEYLFNKDAPCEGCETYKVLKTNAPHRWEWTGPDGHNYDIYDLPFVEADGSTLILEMGIDITERKQAEAALQAERKRLFAVLETLPAMICLLTPDYHVAFANRPFRERFGESGGRHCYEYCFGRTQPCEFCESYKVLETGKPHHWEVTGPEGSVIDAYDFPFTDVDGSPMIFEMDIDITEQKRAQEALHSASQYVRSLIEVSIDPLVTISAEGKITDVNEATIKATGLSREELIGTDFSTYFTDPEKARAGYRQVFKKGHVTDYPLTIRRKDGRLMDVLYNAAVFKNARGNVLGVFAAARDVTERKRIEEELKRHRDHLEELVKERTADLRESETRLRLAQVSAGAGIWDWDMSTGRLEWSEEFFRLFGLDPKKTNAGFDSWRSVLHPDDRLLAEELIERAIDNRTPLANEYRIVLPSDEVRWINALGNTTCDKSGKPQRMSGICIDITERKLAEEKIKHLASFPQLNPNPVIELDANGKVIYSNIATMKALEQLNASKEIHLFLPDDFTQILKELDSADIKEYSREVRIKESFFIETLLVVPELRVVRIYAHDITGLKSAEEALQKAHNELEMRVVQRTSELVSAQMELERAKRLSDIGTLAATVAHELRNPLAAINMAAANIGRKAQNPLLDRHLATIENKVFESDQIINNLLFYSRIKPPSYEGVNINHILEECINSSRNLFESKKRISVKKRLDSTKDISIDADPLQLKEVFCNILNNACDAAPESGGIIEIFTENTEDSVNINIKDNGSGIANEYMNKIFDPFFSTKAKGTGLGLSVCLQIINLHGGTIGIESEPGKGTSVCIALPKKG